MISNNPVSDDSAENVVVKKSLLYQLPNSRHGWLKSQLTVPFLDAMMANGVKAAGNSSISHIACNLPPTDFDRVHFVKRIFADIERYSPEEE